MAFVTKKNYSGLGISGKLVVSGETMEASTSDVVAPDDCGDVAAFTTVDGGKTPSNTFDIKADVPFTGANAIALGSVTEVDDESFMLTGVTFGTSAGAAPSFSASTTDVESGAATGVVYKLPEFTLPKTHKAAMLFGEATLTGSGCNLTSTQYAASIQPGVDRDELGVPYASSPSGGVLTVNITINQTSTTEPSISAATGWHVSSPLRRGNDKSVYPVWTVSLTRYLERVEPTA